MSKLDIFLLDNFNKIKEEITIKRPKNFHQLLELLENKYKNIKNNYTKFILDKEKK